MSILQDFCFRESNPALLIGNGVNKFNAPLGVLSWDELLGKLWQMVSDQPMMRPSGISITEYYDILELENDEKINFQNEVALILSDWCPFPQHTRIVEYARFKNIPILTTNFDDCFLKSYQRGNISKTRRIGIH